jgi:hypothetical protein
MLVNLNGRPVLGRIAAGIQLAMIVGLWLLLWLPLSVYCLLAIATAPLRRPRGAYQALTR